MYSEFFTNDNKYISYLLYYITFIIFIYILYKNNNKISKVYKYKRYKAYKKVILISTQILSSTISYMILLTYKDTIQNTLYISVYNTFCIIYNAICFAIALYLAYTIPLTDDN